MDSTSYCAVWLPIRLSKLISWSMTDPNIELVKNGINYKANYDQEYYYQIPKENI